jgi:hypothetical protein
MNPLGFDASSPDSAAPSLTAPPRVVFITTNTIKFEFSTDEVCRVQVSYNGGIPVQRLPLQNDFDFEFSVILNELAPATAYDVDLELTDPAGNVRHVPFQASTRPRFFGDPVFVKSTSLAVATTQSGEELRASLQLKTGNVDPKPGYSLSATVYFRAQNGALSTIASAAVATLTAGDGRVDFHVALPPKGAGNPGELWFILRDVSAPTGEPGWVKSLDVQDIASIAW